MVCEEEKEGKIWMQDKKRMVTSNKVSLVQERS